jgi:hypothetical protein
MRFSFLLLAFFLTLSSPAFAQEETTPAETSAVVEEKTVAPPVNQRITPEPKTEAPKTAVQEQAAPAAEDIKAMDIPVSSEPAPTVEPPPLTEMPQTEMEGMSIAVLRAIDKLSARRHTFDVPVGKTVKFSNSLFIKPQACRKSSPLAQPENAAFLQIWERAAHEKESSWVFSGWMFASNPSLSAMDHPVYDVWVIECKNASTSAKSEKFSSESAPETSPEKSPDASKSEKQTGEAGEPVDTGD